MKRFLIMLFSIFLFGRCYRMPPVGDPVRIQALIDTEVTINKTGEILSIKTLEDRQLNAARCITGGYWSWQDTVFSPAIYDTTLFNKYWYRVVKTANGRDTVSSQGMTVFEHRQQEGILKAWNAKKVAITRGNLAEVRADIIASTAWDSIKADNFEGGLKWNLRPLGRKQVRGNLRVFRLNLRDTLLDSIRQDSVAWGWDLLALRDSLNLNNVTLQQVGNREEVPQSLKDYAIANIIPLAGINGQTTVQEAWLDDRIDTRFWKRLFAVFGINQNWIVRFEE